MKYKLTLILVIFFAVAFAQHQDTAFPFVNGRTTFGIKIGLTQSNVYGKDVDVLSASGQATALNGFQVGITANSMIGKYVWLKHELLYTQKGAGLTMNDSINGSYKSILKTGYLDLFPINVAFHFKGLQLYAGPYVSVLVNAVIQRKNSAGVVYNDKSIYGDGTQFEDKGKYLQKLDYGLNAGIEYEFKFGLNAGIRLVRGYAELVQYANSHTFHDSKTSFDVHNTNLNFSIGYSFRKHKTN